MGKTVLILLDLQLGILERVKGANDNYLPRVSEALKAARAAKLDIVHVTTCFRKNYPDISARNQMFSPITSSGGRFVENEDLSLQICPEVQPLEGEVMVTKRRVSGFTGSDLEVVLRSLGAEELVLAGVATGGAVLSTLRQAADMDYGMTVVSDLCMDGDEEVHRLLCEKVFPKQARVVGAQEWIKQISSGR
jgi:nicotinamidase-related amidase